MTCAVFFNFFFFFFNDTATTEIYTLSLHDALPISAADAPAGAARPRLSAAGGLGVPQADGGKQCDGHSRDPAGPGARRAPAAPRAAARGAAHRPRAPDPRHGALGRGATARRDRPRSRGRAALHAPG